MVPLSFGSTALMLILQVVSSTSQTCDGQRSPLGTTYIRWGRTECPDTASLLYEGIAAKAYYSQTGGGINYQCLHRNPQWKDPVADFQHHSYIYGVEYQHTSDALHDHGVPCSVCHVTGRGDKLMIPSRRTCPKGWTKEYAGMLVSAHYQHQGATYECLDEDPEPVLNGAGDQNGGLFYRVEAACGYSMPCPPYVQGYELTCVVCTI